MTSATTKDFGSIRDDYTFFEEHATEAAADLDAYKPHVLPLATQGGPVRFLDFGCGPGSFSARFLTQAGFPPGQLHLSLVEPVEGYLRQAVERLQPFTRWPVEAWSALPAGTRERFDLVLANHVFYYVPDLDTTLRAMLAALASTGLFLATMAGRANLLIQFWLRAFALLGRPVPYHVAEALEAALVRLGVRWDRRPVVYELTFPDTEDNRFKVLRFLLGEHMKDLPQSQVLAFFDEHVQEGQVRIHTAHEQFAIRRG